MFFDREGNLIIWIYPELREETREYTYIPEKHVRIIRENLKQGKKFPEVSPMYRVTREQVAFILKSMKKG